MQDDARKWTKQETEKVDTLSEWVNVVRSLIQIRIRTLECSLSATTSVFNDPAVVEKMSNIHYKSVVVPADNAPNNITLIA